MIKNIFTVLGLFCLFVVSAQAEDVPFVSGIMDKKMPVPLELMNPGEMASRFELNHQVLTGGLPAVGVITKVQSMNSTFIGGHAPISPKNETFFESKDFPGCLKDLPQMSGEDKVVLANLMEFYQVALDQFYEAQNKKSYAENEAYHTVGGGCKKCELELATRTLRLDAAREALQKFVEERRTAASAKK